MTDRNEGCPTSRIIPCIFGYIGILYIAWIGAWILERFLEQKIGWMNTSGGRSAYWTAMKIVLWTLPSLWLIHLSGRRLRDVLGAGNLRHALLWGIGMGVVLGMLSLATKFFMHRPLFAPDLSWALVSAVIIAPAVEEFTFRGAVLGILLRQYRFFAANTITAVFFLGIHLPGWYFQDRLLINLSSVVGGAPSIFLLGWIFGYTAHKGKSITGSILTHSINNLFS